MEPESIIDFQEQKEFFTISLCSAFPLASDCSYFMEKCLYKCPNSLISGQLVTLVGFI